MTRSGRSARTIASPSWPSSALSSRSPLISQERHQDFAVRREVVNDQNGRHVLIHRCFDFNVPDDNVTHSLASERGSRIINP